MGKLFCTATSAPPYSGKPPEPGKALGAGNIGFRVGGYKKT